MDGDFPMFGAAKTPNIGNLEVIFVKEPRKEEYSGGEERVCPPFFHSPLSFNSYPFLPLA
jgi:hypothetical protein